MVTTDGGSGFQNSDIHKSIRADLIKATSDALAYCINTQVLPQWTLTTYGESALAQSPTVEWDVTPPKDRNSEASSLQMTAQALDQLTVAFGKHGLIPNAQEFADRFGVSVRALTPAEKGLLAEKEQERGSSGNDATMPTVKDSDL
jgi:phage gp29-like protein